MATAASTQVFSVYYDGLCHLCSKEINVYRGHDKLNRIRFVDISSPQFDPKKENLDPKRVHKVFHIKNEHGEIMTGVDGFVAIWDKLHIFRPLAALAKSKITRPLFDLGYNLFATFRPFLPKRKCADGYCST